VTVSCHRLEGRTAIVTGGAYGIGRAIAARLAGEGASVLVADVKAEQGQATAAEIAAAGGAVTFVPCDVTDSAQVRAVVDGAVQATGRLDILVNNAGIPGAHGTVTDLDEEVWERVIAVNLGGVYRFAKYALPHLIVSGRGSMINLASTFGMIGAHGTPAYAASKGGVIAISRQMAVDFGPHNVRVNAVAPGYVDNDMDQRRTRMTPEDAAANYAARRAAAELQPLGRQCDTAEIAAAVAFLASDDASFVTGAVIPVDGGCTSFFNYGQR
jgi:NAD(P)-dependent dehydrogenase (short-subunit alcohol dehydrogenase family)